MSVATLSTPPPLVGTVELLPPVLPPQPARPAHWLQYARPVYGFFAHPLAFALAWCGLLLFLLICIALLKAVLR